MAVCTSTDVDALQATAMSIECLVLILTLIGGIHSAVPSNTHDQVEEAENSPASCSFDPSPCQCEDVALEGYQITCAGVTGAQVQSVFQHSNVMDHYQLRLKVNFTYIPADLLAGKRVRDISLTFSNASGQNALQDIDADAFRSSENYTESIYILTDRSRAFDLSFMANFVVLKGLTLTGESTAFESIPALPSLSYLFISSPGFQDVLDEIHLYNDTLVSLFVTGVSMKSFPPEVESLSRLLWLDLSFNDFGVIGNGSIAVSAKLTKLSLMYSEITHFEPAAFQGDFRSTGIDLAGNQMEKLEEFPFRPLLQSMTSGYILLLNNGHYLSCDCHLTWLLMENRHLLSRVQNGRCLEPGSSEAVPLEEFDSDKLSTCSGGTMASTAATSPVTETPDVTTSTPATTPNKCSQPDVSSVSYLILLVYLYPFTWESFSNKIQRV